MQEITFLGMFSFILPNFSMMDAGVLQGHREIGEMSSGKTQVTSQILHSSKTSARYTTP